MKPKQKLCVSTSMIAFVLSVVFFYGCRKEADLTATDTALSTDAIASTDSLSGSISATAARNSSALILESPFEASGLLNGWSNMQHCCNYSVTGSTKFARAGSQSIKFDLYNTDAIVSQSKRAEITRPVESETNERWYGGSFYLETYASDNGPESIIQWHDVDGTTPPLSVQIGGGKLRVVQSFAGQSLIYNEIGAATTGKWVDIVIHVKWTTSSNGLLEVWRDGTKVVTRTGRTQSKGGNYLKLGINKWSWAPGGGSSSSTHRVMYWDEFRIGNERATYADVAPGGTTTTPTPPPPTTPSNQLPVVSAGAAQTINLPVSTASLNGTATDADGTIASYSWTKVSGGVAVITAPTSKSTTITGLVAGTYVFNLKATDNKGGVGSSNVTVNVNAAVVTPPSGVRKNLMLESTYESSNYLMGWSNMQHCCDYSVTNASGIARAGSKSVKFDVRRTDAIVSQSVRAEITQDVEAESADRWYGGSFYLSNYASDNGGESIIQWHDVDGSMPPLSLQIWGTDMIVMQAANGALTQNNIGKVVSNQWIDLVFHVKWSTGNDGILEVWRNGTKVVSKTGIKTNTRGGNYLKLGLNKWSWAPGGGTSSVSNRVFYVDEFRIGNQSATYNDVKPGN